MSTQVGWQTPTTSREEIQLIVHMSRPLSDQLLSVDLSAVVLNLQHIIAFLHSNVLHSRPQFRQGNPELVPPWLIRFRHRWRSCCSVLHPLAPSRVACEVVHTTIQQLRFPPQAAVHLCPSSHEPGPRSNQQNVNVSVRKCRLAVPARHWMRFWTPVQRFRHTSERHVGNKIVSCAQASPGMKKRVAWGLSFGA